MNCPYCDNEANWCENKEIYGINYGKSYMLYLCKPCDAYVGCHENTEKALGTLANKELRILRKEAHGIFDPKWKNNQYTTRKQAYKILSKAFQRVTRSKVYKKVHIGESGVNDCKIIIGIMKHKHVRATV